MAPAPVLETGRLLLRPQQNKDWPPFLETLSSERAVHLGGPFSKSAAWGWFCDGIAQWELFGHGTLVIEDKATGEALGVVAVNAGPLFPEHELGWILFDRAEGRGIAFEAAEALRNWAFETRGLDTLVSYIGPENHRSIALAERLGAHLDPDAEGQDHDDLVYRHPRG